MQMEIIAEKCEGWCNQSAQMNGNAWETLRNSARNKDPQRYVGKVNNKTYRILSLISCSIELKGHEDSQQWVRHPRSGQSKGEMACIKK